ncbi:branched-chain-amino acid aminotransferase, partial [Bacteroides finegoldii]
MPVSQLQTEEIKWISPKNRFELYTVWEGAKYYFYFFFCLIRLAALLILFAYD